MEEFTDARFPRQELELYVSLNQAALTALVAVTVLCQAKEGRMGCLTPICYFIYLNGRRKA